MRTRPLHWWQYLVPTYGNWGGPGWSGGEYIDDRSMVQWNVDPIDSMDDLFRVHDSMIQMGSGSRAHRRLYRSLERLDSPKEWGIWPRAYRLAAIGIFWVLSKIPSNT